MQNFTRFAVFVMPEFGALAWFTTQWMGWDAVSGKMVNHCELADLSRPVSEITAAVRKYGFHGTIKPPFRLATGKTITALSARFQELCATTPPVDIGQLSVGRMGSFVALLPEYPCAGLSDLAARFVTELDPYRASLTETMIQQRRARGLSAYQDEMLMKWGYPYVLDAFRFHMTLTGKLPKSEAKQVQHVLQTAMNPLLRDPYLVKSLCLCGEDSMRRFHLITRAALAG